MFIKPHIKIMRILIVSFFFILLPFQGWAQISIEDSLRYYLNSNFPDIEKIDQLNVLITRYAANDPIIAIQYSDSSIQLSNSLNDSVRLAHSIGRKGIALFFLGDHNEALSHYLQAVSIKEAIGKHNLLGSDYNNIGLLLRNMGQNNESLNYYRMALKAAEDNGDRKQEATIWNNIGINLRRSGEPESAREAFERSLSISTQLGLSQIMALSYNNLGNGLIGNGLIVESMDYYRKAIEINRILNNRYEHANCLNNLAASFILLNEHQNAQSTLNEAEGIIKSIGSTFLQINNLTLMSDLLIKQKHFERAIDFIEKRNRLKDSISLIDRSKQFDQIKAIVSAEKRLQDYQLLKQINEIQQDKIKNAKIIQLLAGIVLIIVLTFLFILFRNNKVIRKLNRSLVDRTKEVEELNDELQVANEELEAQRDSLIETLDKLEKAQDKLLQSKKMASLGVLAAGIAHEINNPLNFIQGGVNAIKNSIEDMPRKKSQGILSLVEIIETGVNRAAAIVSSLNYYSRKDNHKSETCDIHRIIQDSLLILNHRIEGRIEVSKELTNDYFSVICNEGKIHQAILNILSNAIDSIENKGKIRICTELKDQIVWITIIDSGCGIPSENLAKITDPFFTTKDPDKGTGLGLAVALKTIQDINGSLEFWSDVGKGTIVQIKLPTESISS